MNKPFVTTLCLLVLAVPATAVEERDDGSKAVAALVRNTVDKVLLVLKDEKLSRQDKRNAVMKVIEPVIDFPLMGKLSLGPKRWPKLKPEQRDAFTKLFVETLKSSYFEKLDLFSDEVVEYKKPVKKKSKFYVLTYIVSKGERIEVAYKLYLKKDAWKVYDFEIEGVSILKSYGSQYRDFLKEGSFEELLERLRKKIEAARKKERETPPEKKTEKKKDKDDKKKKEGSI